MRPEKTGHPTRLPIARQFASGMSAEGVEQEPNGLVQAGPGPSDACGSSENPSSRPITHRVLRKENLPAKVVVVKGNSGFAGEVDERSAKRQERGHEQERNAVFVGDIEQRADEGDDDDEGG